MKMKENRPRGMRPLLGSANGHDLKKNRKWQFTTARDFPVVDTGSLAKLFAEFVEKACKIATT